MARVTAALTKSISYVFKGILYLPTIMITAIVHFAHEENRHDNTLEHGRLIDHKAHNFFNFHQYGIMPLLKAAVTLLALPFISKAEKAQWWQWCKPNGTWSQQQQTSLSRIADANVEGIAEQLLPLSNYLRSLDETVSFKSVTSDSTYATVMQHKNEQRVGSSSIKLEQDDTAPQIKSGCQIKKDLKLEQPKNITIDSEVEPDASSVFKLVVEPPKSPTPV